MTKKNFPVVAVFASLYSFLATPGPYGPQAAFKAFILKDLQSNLWKLFRFIFSGCRSASKKVLFFLGLKIGLWRTCELIVAENVIYVANPLAREVGWGIFILFWWGFQDIQAKNYLALTTAFFQDFRTWLCWRLLVFYGLVDPLVREVEWRTFSRGFGAFGKIKA